jgi:hypothetical protein
MRKCGECEACCEFAEIKEGDFYKPAFQKCEHQCNGCAIFGKLQRPGICNSYQCSWLRGFGNEDERPDKNGIIVSINRINNLDYITAIELRPNSFIEVGKNIIVEIIEKTKLPVLIFDFESVPPKTGDRVAVHKSIEKRCKNLIGDFIEKLNEDINIYKLIKSGKQ